MTKAIGLGSAAVLGTIGTVVAAAQPASAQAAGRWPGECIAGSDPSSRVTFTLNGHEVNGRIRLTSVDYTFRVRKNSGNHTVGDSTNINITSPVNRTSPDNMGSGGTYDFTNFDVDTNTNIRVQGIPDFGGVGDPSCSTTIHVGLK